MICYPKWIFVVSSILSLMMALNDKDPKSVIIFSIIADALMYMLFTVLCETDNGRTAAWVILLLPVIVALVIVLRKSTACSCQQE